MATRPLFIAEASGSILVRVKSVEFIWHSGMAKERRQLSMRSLHESARLLHPEARILEVSRMSDDALGERLSAFNLTCEIDNENREVAVECAFQASKVFGRSGPFLDLLHALPSDAKRDTRLRDSGPLTGFRFRGEDWPNEPATAFYDWIYINALHRRPDIASEVIQFDIFTDIAFNPEKSVNCQAGAVALYVALVRRGEIKAALSSRQAFLRIEAGARLETNRPNIQCSLF